MASVAAMRSKPSRAGPADLASRPVTHRRPVLVYLHGHGSSPAEVAPTVARLDPEGDFVTVTPEAPLPVGDGGGSWYDHGTRGADAASLTASVERVLHVLGAMERDLGLARDDVVLAGFSQGASLAVAVAARSTAAFGALVLQAPFVPEGLDVEVDPRRTVPTDVLVQHGRDDEVVPDFLGRDLADALLAAGSKVDFESLACGHERSDEMLEGARRWLAARFGGPRG